MPNSIRTTLNTQTTTNSTLAIFKAGDSVLCPSIGNGAYKLFNDKEYDCLGFTLNGKTYHYCNDGKVSRDDKAPSLFYDTPANRQAINTLFGSAHQIKMIDTTDTDDKEVVLMSSHNLVDIACDINSAITVMYDIGQLLALIHYERIEPHAAIALARLTHDAAETWANLLQVQLNAINETLVMTGYSKVGD